MADTASPGQPKVYTNFVNKKPWVDPSFVRKQVKGPYVAGENSSALFGYEYDPSKKKEQQSARIDLPKVDDFTYTSPGYTLDYNTATNANNRTDENLDSSGVNYYLSDYNKPGYSNTDRDTYNELERGVYNLEEKVGAVDKKVDTLHEGYRYVPSRVGEVETNMASRGYQVDDLQWRNKVHSAKIHELERELRSVKMDNDNMKGRIVGGSNGSNLSQIPEDSYRGGGGQSDRNGYGGGYDAGPASQRYDAPDPYYGNGNGSNRAYDSPRQQQPAAPAEGQGRQRRVYENEQHNIAHRHGGPDGEPYWGFNKYYNPQFVTAYRREQVPYYARKEEREQGHQQAGGLYIIRFHDSGFDEVNVSLKEQQTIIKSFNGHLLGIARKDNVIVFDGESDWRYSKNPAPRRQLGVKHHCVDDCIGVVWFPSREKAFDFFSNSFRNRFKQQGFPTPHGWEGHYVPLEQPPMYAPLDTYLVIEATNIGYTNNEDRLQRLQNFEITVREEMKKLFPSCLPFIASVMKGRDALKPGPLFKDRSKVFVSRFSSLNDVADLWSTGIIQSLARGLPGPINVSAFSLKDCVD